MIEFVERALAQLGLAPATRPMRYCINLTTGQAMSISVYLDGKQDFYQVKISEFIDLKTEYAAYQRAWADFPDFVPRPIAYSTHERWCMIVAQGISHKPLPLSLLTTYNDSRPTRPIPDLLRFFGSARRQRQSEERDTHQPLLETLDLHFSKTPLAPHSQRWINNTQEEVKVLPSAPQHGDFVLNNLAVSEPRLVIFDWEDYGQVTLQGLDLATLAISVWGFNFDTMRALADPKASLGAPMMAFLRRACEQCGIEFDLFRRLFPLYVLVFLYLKRNYGFEVKERLSNLLRYLSA